MVDRVTIDNIQDLADAINSGTPGLTISLAPNRLHVGAAQWLSQPATDYWFFAGNGDLSTASGATNVAGLDSYGWTTTSLVYTNSVTANFISSVTDTPPNMNSDAAADLLRSPIIFGSYSHALGASRVLGYVPTQLVCEFYAAFTTLTANEAGTMLGLHNGAATVLAVYSGGTGSTFLLHNGSATLPGPAVGTAGTYHLWQIVVDSVKLTAQLLVDGVSYGTLAIVNGVWPAAFNALAGTTNRFAVSWAHVYYQ